MQCHAWVMLVYTWTLVFLCQWYWGSMVSQMFGLERMCQHLGSNLIATLRIDFCMCTKLRYPADPIKCRTPYSSTLTPSPTKRLQWLLRETQTNASMNTTVYSTEWLIVQKTTDNNNNTINAMRAVQDAQWSTKEVMINLELRKHY